MIINAHVCSYIHLTYTNELCSKFDSILLSLSIDRFNKITTHSIYCFVHTICFILYYLNVIDFSLSKRYQYSYMLICMYPINFKKYLILFRVFIDFKKTSVILITPYMSEVQLYFHDA